MSDWIHEGHPSRSWANMRDAKNKNFYVLEELPSADEVEVEESIVDRVLKKKNKDSSDSSDSSDSVKKTKAPTIRKTKAPTIRKTKAPTVKRTKAPTVKRTKRPSGSRRGRRVLEVLKEERGIM